MKDCFFTLGGGQFWEDLFVCNDWRIQRNLTARKFRLLDNWNIIRAEGNFKRCRNEFERFYQAYEMPNAENKRMIILLHGFGQNSKIFNKLKTYLNKRGITAQAIEYPSMQRSIKGHAKQLNFLLDNLKDVTDVTLITFGISNIIAEIALKQRTKQVSPLRIDKLIEIAPLVKSNAVLNKLSKIWGLRFILGATARDLEETNLKRLHYVPDLKIGVIAAKPSRWQTLAETLLNIKRVKQTPQEIKQWCGTEELLNSRSRKSYILEKKNIHEAIARFLESSKF